MGQVCANNSNIDPLESNFEMDQKFQNIQSQEQSFSNHSKHNIDEDLVQQYMQETSLSDSFQSNNIKQISRRYTGDYKNGLAEGRGTLKVDQNYTFDGEWSNGKPNGYGLLKFINGDYYKGNLKDGKFDDKNGYFSEANGYFIYEGAFNDGKFHGDGVAQWKDGKQYQGQFQNGKFHGSGTYEWPDGRKFVGQYKNGLKHGDGQIFLNDGTVYVGQWNDGNYIGQGIIKKGNKVLRKGVWKSGYFVAFNQFQQILLNQRQQINIIVFSNQLYYFYIIILQIQECLQVQRIHINRQNTFLNLVILRQCIWYKYFYEHIQSIKFTFFFYIIKIYNIIELIIFISKKTKDTTYSLRNNRR